MSVTIYWGGAQHYGCPLPSGGQTATINHPKELRHWGHPRPPLQPIADWPSLLSEFQAMMNAGKFEAVLSYPIDNYLSITTADIPGGALAGLKLWIQNNCVSIPGTLVGLTTDWTADGTPRGRS